jgi:hypothetical protein
MEIADVATAASEIDTLMICAPMTYSLKKGQRATRPSHPGSVSAVRAKRFKGAARTGQMTGSDATLWQPKHRKTNTAGFRPARGSLPT